VLLLALVPRSTRELGELPSAEGFAGDESQVADIDPLASAAHEWGRLK
jgi:hypothetical protein